MSPLERPLIRFVQNIPILFMVKNVLELIDELIVEKRFPQAVIFISNRPGILEDLADSTSLKIHALDKEMSHSKIRPDLYNYYPEGKTCLHSIDAMRGLNKRVGESPFEKGHKVFVIHSVDRMTAQVSTVLLKTLEEPPSDTVFILTSYRKQNISETLLSRCKVFFIPNNKDYFLEEFKERSFFEDWFSLMQEEVCTLSERLTQSVFGKRKNEKEDIMFFLNFILLCYRDRYLLDFGDSESLTFPDYVSFIKTLSRIPLNRVLSILSKSSEVLEKGTNKSFCIEWALLELGSLSQIYNNRIGSR